MIYIYVAILVLVIAVAVFRIGKRKQIEVHVDEYEFPSSVNRKDFIEPDKDLIVIAFTSAKCDSCQGVWEKVSVLDSEHVAVTKIEFEDSVGKKLHQRYSIEAVPTTIVCDSNGTTLKSYIGAATATDLWAGVASARGDEIQQCSNH